MQAPPPGTSPRAAAGQRVLLLGMMGSGKSTIGRALAQRTGWPFLDNDELLERRTGRTARDLREVGVDALREGESLALHEGLAVPPPAIVGVAAGVVLDPADRAAVRDGGVVVWLRANPETLLRRILGTLDEDEGRHRPWLGGGPDAALAWLRTEADRRQPLYESVAGITVDVDEPDWRHRPAGAVAAEILNRMGAPNPGTG